MRLLTALFLSLASPIMACPDLPMDTKFSETMLSDLAMSDTYSTAQKAVAVVWEHWLTAPDTQAQELLDEGLSRIRQADYKTAQAVLMELSQYCPNYPEGYNQLAFAQFLANDLEASQASLNTTLKLEPRHFGALSGLGLIAQKRGNLPLAKIWIGRAIKIHPFLNERGILDIPEKVDEL